MMNDEQQSETPGRHEIAHQLISQGFDEDLAWRLAALEQAIERASKRNPSPADYCDGSKFVEL